MLVANNDDFHHLVRQMRVPGTYSNSKKKEWTLGKMYDEKCIRE
jgi:hypothetical protein